MRCNIHDFDIMEEGKELGRSEAKLEAARNLINLGVSLDIIAQAQGLPLETVQQLARFAEAQSTD